LQALILNVFSTPYTNAIHIRDFVDAVTDDPNKADNHNYIEIQSDINVFNEDQFYTRRVTVEPIRARVRAYIPQVERDVYIPNAFFYANGRFSTTTTSDNTLGITVYALSLKRYFHYLCPNQHQANPSQPPRRCFRLQEVPETLA
jgi:hypothetical protein